MSTGILLTPILWDKERLGVYENYVYINPFTSMIVIRSFYGHSGKSNCIFYIIYFVIGFIICSIFTKKYKVFLVIDVSYRVKNINLNYPVYNLSRSLRSVILEKV